ncbi:MAG: hypothetical protein FJZ01_01300 [Candidatus Sericytochromatia bacterium]|nr:hypothetical protein [Candidatus Tanganyikabacteria bacterium]
MKFPPLTPPHGTSLASTAGITAVITVVAAASVLAQCARLSGMGAILGMLAVACLIAGAGGLYVCRNRIGMALDLAATPEGGPAAGVTAASGLTQFHLGMAGVFAGIGLAAAVHLALPLGGIAWVAPAGGGVFFILSLAKASAWHREAGRRRLAAAPRT